jgi:hypothetical protein
VLVNTPFQTRVGVLSRTSLEERDDGEYRL